VYQPFFTPSGFTWTATTWRGRPPVARLASELTLAAAYDPSVRERRPRPSRAITRGRELRQTGARRCGSLGGRPAGTSGWTLSVTVGIGLPALPWTPNCCSCSITPNRIAAQPDLARRPTRPLRDAATAVQQEGPPWAWELPARPHTGACGGWASTWAPHRRAGVKLDLGRHAWPRAPTTRPFSPWRAPVAASRAGAECVERVYRWYVSVTPY